VKASDAAEKPVRTTLTRQDGYRLGIRVADFEQSTIAHSCAEDAVKASDAAEKPVRTTLTRQDGYRFRVRFDQEGMPDLLTDEPPPLGQGSGPSPSRLLAAAIGNCLAASLLFCTGKARLDVAGLEAEVDVTTTRNAEGRLRIGRVDVRLVPTVTAETRARMGRCLEIYESFCTVTESLRAGLDVAVRVEPEVRA